jgi:ABC-type lipoprotein release transport system permease subunit
MLIGVAIGLLVTFPTTDVMVSMLYGVSPRDMQTIAVVAVILSGVAAVACYLPAWRVTKGDPVEALRYQ